MSNAGQYLHVKLITVTTCVSFFSSTCRVSEVLDSVACRLCRATNGLSAVQMWMCHDTDSLQLAAVAGCALPTD